jgi:hypothetical protein
MKSEVMMVTPELAAEWLEHNTHNRIIRPRVVDKYAADMKAGRWLLTHQGIAFDEHNVLVDGQHRLMSVVQSGTPVKMMVTRGVSLVTQIAVDDHSIRTVADALRLAEAYNVTSMHVAITHRMMVGIQAVSRRASKQEIKAFLDKYFDGVDFAANVFAGQVRGITQAAVRAVLGRAYYSVDSKVLKRFADVLTTGLMTEGEEAAIVMRNWLLQPVSRYGGAAHQRLVYAKAQRALYSFIRAEPIKKLYAAENELFELPASPPRVTDVGRAFPNQQ